MGLTLFTHSVRLVFTDLAASLRISGVLYLITAIPSLLLAFMVTPGGAPGPANILLGLVVVVLLVVCTLWIAVAWHRYVLLNEIPAGLLPPFNGNRILAYFGNSLLIGLVLLAAWIVVTGLVFLLAASLQGAATAVGVIIGIIAIVLVLIASYRLSPILPAAAIGQPLRMGEAWEATKGATGAIIVLAIVSVIAALVIDIPAFVLVPLGSAGVILSQVWTIATGWVKLVVGVSIVTTLYGVYVERRELPR